MTHSQFKYQLYKSLVAANFDSPFEMVAEHTTKRTLQFIPSHRRRHNSEDPLIFCSFHTSRGYKWDQLKLDDHWSSVCGNFKPSFILHFHYIETVTSRHYKWPSTEHPVIRRACDWEAFQSVARTLAPQWESGCSTYYLVFGRLVLCLTAGTIEIYFQGILPQLL
jgi:hypothetical protein